MGRCYPPLSLEERRRIANWRYARTPVSEIADQLCRDASTIYREIKRNSCRFDDQPELNGYHALAAQCIEN
jgi:IS30 family transposase